MKNITFPPFNFHTLLPQFPSITTLPLTSFSHLPLLSYPLPILPVASLPLLSLHLFPVLLPFLPYSFSFNLFYPLYSILLSPPRMYLISSPDFRSCTFSSSPSDTFCLLPLFTPTPSPHLYFLPALSLHPFIN